MSTWSDECKVFENCIRCRNGLPHPPVLAVYDHDERDYLPATEAVCMARWASDGNGHRAGGICGAPATQEAGDVDLCQHHFDRVYDWRFWEKPLKDIEEKTAALKAADEEYRRAVLASAVAREKADAEIGVVYFVRRTSDGMVKIGTTTAFRSRMNALRAEHGELQVLLTVSGGRKREAEMHARFSEYRRAGTEWFAPVRSLLWWIYQERLSPRYRDSQKDGAVRTTEVRKMADAAPRLRDLTWKAGRVVWPIPEAA